MISSYLIKIYIRTKDPKNKRKGNIDIINEEENNLKNNYDKNTCNIGDNNTKWIFSHLIFQSR